MADDPQVPSPGKARRREDPPEPPEPTYPSPDSTDVATATDPPPAPEDLEAKATEAEAEAEAMRAEAEKVRANERHEQEARRRQTAIDTTSKIAQACEEIFGDADFDESVYCPEHLKMRLLTLNQSRGLGKLFQSLVAADAYRVVKKRDGSGTTRRIPIDSYASAVRWLLERIDGTGTEENPAED
ncbi:MAG: hypothetical protein AAF663_00095 [Planctomycetota bacterium]